MKSLITGGAGAVGYFLARTLLQQGQEVVILDNLSRGKIDIDLTKLLENPAIKFIQADITERESFDSLDTDFDFVYHLAAINGTKNFYEIPHQVLRVGVQGVLNVLNWFKSFDKGKILFTSSNEAYASWISLNKGPLPTPEDVPLCIDDVMNPRWSYGGSKLIGELLFVNYARVYGFPMSVIRYHNSYGPRMGYEHVIPEFLERILAKKDAFEIFGADAKRAFCYIDDTVRATQMIMEAETTNGEIIHVGNDEEEISIFDLANKMFNLFDYKPNEIKIYDAPEGSVLRRCPDLAKIKKLTSYRPQVGLEEGLMKTYAWYKDNQ